MRYSIAAGLALASTVNAHTWMYGVWVNGADQGNGRSKYIRTPPNNDPVKDLSSPNLVCNVNGGKAVPSFVQAAAGDKITFEWQHDNRGDDIIAASHKGPVITWIAEYTEGAGTGAIWSKIAEEGLSGGQWATDKLIAAKGKADFTLPSGLAAGKYLLRQEIIAHHESESTFDQNPARGAQFYPSCVQFEITGSGSDVPNQGFDFNKDYTYSDPGIKVNVYGSITSYEIPGPEVYAGGSGGGSPNPPQTPPATPPAPPTPTAAPPAPTTQDSGPAPTPEFTTVEDTAPLPTPPSDYPPETPGLPLPTPPVPTPSGPRPGRPSGRPSGRPGRPGRPSGRPSGRPGSPQPTPPATPPTQGNQDGDSSPAPGDADECMRKKIARRAKRARAAARRMARWAA